MRKLIKSILPKVGVEDLKIRPRGDNRCESAKGIPGSVSAISRAIWVRRRLLCKHPYVQERVPSVSLAIASCESLLSWINRLVPSSWSVH